MPSITPVTIDQGVRILFNTALTRVHRGVMTMAMMLGPPGCTKTSSIIAECARQSELTGVEHVPILMVLSGKDIPDVTGFAFMQNQRIGDQEHLVSVFALSALLEQSWRVYAEGKIPVLILDEFFQTPEPVVKPVRQLITEGSIGSQKLPPNTLLMGTSNRLEDNAGVEAQMSHVTNAIVMVNVTHDIENWRKKYARYHLDPRHVSFVVNNPDMLADTVPAEANEPFCTLRSMTNASILHMAHSVALSGTELTINNSDAWPRPSDMVHLDDSRQTKAMLRGIIGEAAATTLFTYLEFASEIPDRTSILKSPDSCHVPGKDRVDVQLMMAHILPSICPSMEDLQSRPGGMLTPDDHDVLDAVLCVAERMKNTAVLSQVIGNIVSYSGNAVLQAPRVQHAMSTYGRVISDVISKNKH